MARPSIMHLLGWTAGTAVVLAMSKLHDPNIDPSQWSLEYLTLILLERAAYGAALAALAMTVLRRCRGQNFPTQPGEWYLVALAGGTFLQELFGFVVRQLSTLRSDTDYLFITIGTFIIGAVPFVVAFIHGGGGVNWKAVFGAQIAVKSLLLLTIIASVSLGYSEFWTELLSWIRGLHPFFY